MFSLAIGFFVVSFLLTEFADYWRRVDDEDECLAEQITFLGLCYGDLGFGVLAASLLNEIAL